MLQVKFVKEARKVFEECRCVYVVYKVGNYGVTVTTYIYENNRYENEITVFVDKGSNAYSPAIYYVKPFTEGSKPYFAVQTVSHGALKIDDIKAFAKAYDHAAKVAEALTEYFCK